MAEKDDKEERRRRKRGEERRSEKRSKKIAFIRKRGNLASCVDGYPKRETERRGSGPLKGDGSWKEAGETEERLS
jgi:hypothetical protein